jgi:predicted acyl esterase
MACLQCTGVAIGGYTSFHGIGGLGATRIGHGVNLISDPDTMLMMRHNRYLVEISLVSNQVLEYTIRLPQVNHTFRRGHRLMVQIQSTWFPLVDRNPQKFVPNIYLAKPEDYQKATQRVLRSVEHPSSIRLGVVPTPKAM